MILASRLCRFSALSFVFVLCLSVLGSPAQVPEAPQGRRIPGDAGVRPRQLLREALRRGPESEALGQELLRLLTLPEAQKALGISDEQRKKLEDIAFNTRKATIQQRATLQVQRMELERLMRADNPDRAAIEKKVQEVSQAQSTMMRARVNGLLDVRAALTKEQRDKIRDHLQNQVRQGVQERLQGVRPGPRQAAPAPGPQGPPPPPAPPRPPGQ